MPPQIKYLVVDSGAFIKHSPVHEYSENVYTVSGAVKEIKDKATLQHLQVLPYKLNIKEPSPEACKEVADFSKKTGDYASLSAVDLQIIALTYQLQKEHSNVEHLNKDPVCKVTGKPVISEKDLAGFYVPKKSSRKHGSSISSSADSEMNTDVKDEEKNLPESDIQDSASSSGNHGDEKEFNNEETDSEDDEDGWITPENISDIRKAMGDLSVEENKDIDVACITTDFSVQNVLLQMGLHVTSVEGMLIRETRVFILRCHSCFKTTNNIMKKFCPHCGNQTLKKVAVTVNEDGTKNIHINFKRPINIRGTRYSLPMPKGGKHAVNPILCEGQPVPHNRPPKSALQKTDVYGNDYEIRTSPFALNDVYSRAASLGIRANTGPKRRKNPNEWSIRTGNKK